VIKSKIIIPAIVLGLLIAGATAWTTAKAAVNSGNSGITEQLSEKLGIEESKVSDAMDQIRQERQAEREKQISVNLDKAVADGVITSEQKQKILDKMTEMQQKREQERKEFQAWQQENGIDISKLHDYGIGFGGGRGGRGFSGSGFHGSYK